MSKKSKLVVGGTVALGALVATVAFGGSAANADPSPTGFRTYAAVGSDTIQDVYNGLSNGYSVSGTAKPAVASSIASYNATGSPATVTTKSGATALTRPNGSGAGRAALSAALNPSNHHWTGQTADVTPNSIDIARSSGQPAAGFLVSGSAVDGPSDNLTSVPLARDAVSVATKGFTFNGSTGFTAGALEAIYGAPAHADGTFTQSTVSGHHTVGDVMRNTASATAEPVLVTGVSLGAGANTVTSTQQLNVFLPQNGSGTRQFFTGALGDTANTAATWVNQSIEENTGSALTATGDIAPFSAAQYVAQERGVVANTGLTGVNLNAIGGKVAITGTGTSTTANTNVSTSLYGDPTVVPNGAIGTFSRDTYSVVSSLKIDTQRRATTGGTLTTNPSRDATLSTLVTSTLPNATAITDFGFLKIGYSATTSDWLTSSYEN
jgi:hypothetical protein